MSKQTTSKPTAAKPVVIDKHSSNEEIFTAMPKVKISKQVVLYAIEDHGIEGQSWGYMIHQAPDDPISGNPGGVRRCANAINDSKLADGTYAVGEPVKIPGLCISRRLTLNADEPGASPLANREGQQLTSMGQPVYQVMFLSIGKKDDNAGIVIDKSTGTRVAQ